MDSILPWLKLKSVPGIGNHLFKKLIDRFGSPETVLNASPKELSEINGISFNIANAVKNQKTSDSIKREIDLAFQKKITIVTMANDNYPVLLHELPDPPPLLYVLGDMEKSMSNIAVVGSRNATHYGITTATSLCKELVSYGLTIVSGMARGIDTAAHQGTLMAQGKTIAILGSGLGNIYPAENLKLSYRIAENGAVVSEFPIMTAPEAHNFPIRNRIISGMSLGTLVVEAAKRSGSLITARLAAEQGREVFAVPGSIKSFKSSGTHSLLKQGAKLVENAQDILDEISHMVHVINRPSDSGASNKPGTSNKTDNRGILSEFNKDELMVLDALEIYPIHIDELARKISIESGKLAGILLRFELQGIVIQTPGKYFNLSEEK